MQKNKPWSLEASDGWDDTGTGCWHPSVRPATDGWTEEDIRVRKELQRHTWQLSGFAITHGFWDTFSGPDRVDARTELIRVSLTIPAETKPTGQTGAPNAQRSRPASCCARYRQESRHSEAEHVRSDGVPEVDDGQRRFAATLLRACHWQ
jgi:hypothetical protein